VNILSYTLTADMLQRAARQKPNSLVNTAGSTISVREKQIQKP
jgi:hypothetical protein